MKRPKRGRTACSRCYGCGLYFIPGEMRATEVLCQRCNRKPMVEMEDALGLPKTFERSRMDRQSAKARA